MSQDFRKLKLSVDTKENLKDIRKIYKVFYPNINFSFQDMLMNKKQKNNK